MSITYKNNKDLPCDQLSALFTAVGWSDGTEEMIPEMLANFNKPFIHSALVFPRGMMTNWLVVFGH